jgi:hypothetical protein
MTWGEFKKLVDANPQINDNIEIEYIDFDCGLFETGHFSIMVSVEKEEENSNQETLAVDLVRIGVEPISVEEKADDDPH